MKIVIIGAGAAGLMAAANIKAPVLVLERNEKAGKKLYITGKGRCNLTNNVAPADFLKRVTEGEKFARGMIYRFPPEFVMDFFEDNGLKLKTERGNRVFPVSEKASDVSKTLLAVASRQDGQFLYNTFVKAVRRHGDGYKIITENEEITADILVVAAGGKSYPSTGSDGSVYEILRSLGHNISPLYPSLVPFILKEDTASLRGISFKNVGARVSFSKQSSGKINGQEKKGEKKDGEVTAEGEMLFTDNGVSGPLVLTLSSLCAAYNNLNLFIDFFPNKTREQIDKKLIDFFSENGNILLKNILAKILPKSLASYIIENTGIGDKQGNSVTRAERDVLTAALKGLNFTVAGTSGFNEAVTTRGGVDLKQIDPKTMESRINKNLYIIGEILDMDALTGGFNLQLCFSSALAAAEAINGLIL